MSQLYLTPRWFPIPEPALKHPTQVQLLSDLNEKKYSNFVIVGGRRTFKTERFLKRWIAFNAIRARGEIHLLGAPTRQQAKNIFWEDMKQMFKPYFIVDVYESELRIRLRNGCIIEIIGLKEFERQEGKRAHVVAITEFQQCDPKAYTQAIQPMLIDTNGIGIFDGRPLGKNHLYDYYNRGQNGDEGWMSYHWTAEDILTEKQIRQAKKDLSEQDYNREYRASFETGSVSPYQSYSSKNHKKLPFFDASLPIIVTCDFNATEKPMSWVVGQKHEEKEYWVKALQHQFTNTEQMCRVFDEFLTEVFGDYAMRKNKLILNFYGDYAGEHTTSNSSISDWRIIEHMFARKTIFKKKIKPCLSIRSSIGATNARLRNALGEVRQYIDYENCKPLADDWNKSEWESNSFALKESTNPLLGHACRAVDYYNEYEYPLYKNETKVL